MSDNLYVTIEKFLSFWSLHTTVIIEALFAVVILFSLFLAYRNFFGAKAGDDAGHGSGAGQNLDTAQLEKTLQKILENQSHGPKHVAVEEDLSSHPALEEEARAPRAAASADGVSVAEIAQLKTSLSDSSKKIEILQAQLLEAQQSGAAQGAASAADAGGGINDELNAKIRDLEARLSEYEIISEDIADLSRYREENDDLKKQLEALKASAAAAPVAAAKAPAAPTPPTPEPVMAAVPEPMPEPIPEPIAAAPEPVAAEAFAAPAMDEMEAAVAALAEQPAEDKVSADLIDDELMKEFAAAVEGQKGLDKAAQKAGDGSAAPVESTDDTDKLMDQFENFVTKKS